MKVSLHGQETVYAMTYARLLLAVSIINERFPCLQMILLRWVINSYHEFELKKMARYL